MKPVKPFCHDFSVLGAVVFDRNVFVGRCNGMASLAPGGGTFYRSGLATSVECRENVFPLTAKINAVDGDAAKIIVDRLQMQSISSATNSIHILLASVGVHGPEVPCKTAT